MGSLDVYYLSEHNNSPIIVRSADAVDLLIDRLRSKSPAAASLMANIFVSSDVYSQDLEVGVKSDCGVIRYSGREWPTGAITINGQANEGELWYFYAGHVREFPTNAEVTLPLVRDAVKEFMATGGARPSCVDWQPGI